MLVADDEPHIGRIIKMKLEQGPFRVTLAYDGREALEVLRREPDIGLVLLDLMMPHLSGLDVLAAISADDRLQRRCPSHHSHRGRPGAAAHQRDGARRERVPHQAVQPEEAVRARRGAGRASRGEESGADDAHEPLGRRPRRRRRLALLAAEHADASEAAASRWSPTSRCSPTRSTRLAPLVPRRRARSILTNASLVPADRRRCCPTIPRENIIAEPRPAARRRRWRGPRRRSRGATGRDAVMISRARRLGGRRRRRVSATRCARAAEVAERASRAA